MEFTCEAWENAPEGATLEYGGFDSEPVTLIGFSKNGRPVVEDSRGNVWVAVEINLRIILPKRKVTVQLWRHVSGGLDTKWVGDVWNPSADWTLLGEHTFEID